MLSSRKKSCYFKRNNIQEIDYKDVKLLTKFINDQGKITAIKRARNIALLPFAAVDRD